MPNRTTEQRIADVRRRLAEDKDVWVATASPEGLPHLVPLSLAWIDGRIVVSTPTDTATVRNAVAAGRVRTALDSTEDVVILDAAVATVDLAAADPDLVERYVARAGWDPREERGAWSLLLLTPYRVQAWRDVHEIRGRTVMRNGYWVGEDR